MSASCRSLAAGLLLVWLLCVGHLHCVRASGANYHPSGNEIHAKLLDQSQQGPASGSNTDGGSQPTGPVSIDDYIRFWGGSPLPGSTTNDAAVNNTSSNGTSVAESPGRRLLRNLLGVWPSYAEGPALQHADGDALDQHRHH